MKQVLHIFLCYMISLGQANEDLLLQEDWAPAAHREYRQFHPSAKGTLKSKDEVLAAELKYPYIDPKCCNLSTTDACSRMGSAGFRGHCMPRNETCNGREYFGTKYCVISKHQSCKCCDPTDCLRQTLSPCATLNGTCIGLNDHCNGSSVISEEFCRRDGKRNTCKCCFPLVTPVTPEECPCGQDERGVCVGTYPGGHGSSGKMAKGRCMETCATGHTSLIDHTCNKTGGTHCKCCDLYDYCGETCRSRELYNCKCMRKGTPCPKGFCAPTETNMCPEGMCTCCLEEPVCESKLDQCSGAKDYCVDKYNDKENGECTKGRSKVYDACSKIGFPMKPGRAKETNATVIISGSIKNCDCCKSEECSSNGDRCTGRGSFCIENSGSCPTGYTESLDCSRPVIIDGAVRSTIPCKCCKPMSADCQKECFRVGSQCFFKTIYHRTKWASSKIACLSHNQSVAEPQDPQALSQHLTDNYPELTYWIGAHGTNNNNAAWISGGVIGPMAPWFASSYAQCVDPNMCLYLQANAGCFIGNQCLGCAFCNGVEERAVLCSCNNTIRFE